MKTALGLLVTVVALGTAGGAARADGTTPGATKAPAYTTGVVDIVGRRAAPIAAIEVARAVPTVKLHEMQSPFLSRIEAGVRGDSF
jgi:hypothetical protein